MSGRITSSVGMAWSLLLSAGCGCPELSDVEVVGGEASERNAVAEFFREFAGLTSSDVCAGKVKITNLKSDIAGSYNATNQNIRIDQAYALDRTTSFHEICHAVERQDDLADEIRGLLETSPAEILIDTHVRKDWRESYAQYCEVGPELISGVAAMNCGEAGYSIYEHIDERVFDNADRPSLLPWNWSQTGVWTIPPDWLPGDIAILAATDDGSLVLHIEDDEEGIRRFVTLDIWTGEEINTGGPTLPVGPQMSHRSWGEIRSVWIEDHFVMLGVARLANGQEAIRQMRIAPSGVVDIFPHCPNASETAFPFQGEYWSGRLEGGNFVWGRWTR